MILTIEILPGGASKRRVVRAVINEGSVNQCIEALFNFRSTMHRVAYPRCPSTLLSPEDVII